MNGRVQHAIEIFQPTPEDRPGNCAEAIYRTFEPDPEARPVDAKAYRRIAKGAAPGNACGAYHAAVEILERRSPDEIDGFARDFKERTGCTTCRAIRKHRLAECRDCVIAAARFLDRVL